MVEFYIKRITEGKMTVDDVPKYWRKAVKEAIENANQNEKM